MALPPHIVKRHIDEMPEGPEKEKRLKSFNTQMKIVAVAYPIMMAIMAVLTIIFIVAMFMPKK